MAFKRKFNDDNRPGRDDGKSRRDDSKGRRPPPKLGPRPPVRKAEPHGFALPKGGSHGRALPKATPHGFKLSKGASHGRALPKATPHGFKLSKAAPRGRALPKSAPHGFKLPKVSPQAATSWEHVAEWYDKLVGDQGSDYHRNVILPATMEMLAPRDGERVLDLCCGQGVVSRAIAVSGKIQVVGVDVSETLIEAARTRTTAANVQYAIGDARKLEGELADGTFDAAASILAVHDVDDLPAMFASLSKSLKQGGRAVLVMMHPCFRVPRQSSWGYDEKLKTQYRRIDRYLSPLQIPIATHPGSDPTQKTSFFHRPMGQYISELGKAGLAVVETRELTSHHRSEPGERARAENRARQEFPMFLAIKAVKL